MWEWLILDMHKISSPWIIGLVFSGEIYRNPDGFYHQIWCVPAIFSLIRQSNDSNFDPLPYGSSPVARSRGACVGDNFHSLSDGVCTSGHNDGGFFLPSELHIWPEYTSSMSLEIIQKPISKHTLYIYTVYTYLCTYIYIYNDISRWLVAASPSDQELHKSCGGHQEHEETEIKVLEPRRCGYPNSWMEKTSRKIRKKKTSSYDGWYICYVYSMDYHLLSMIIYGISMHVTSFHHKWVSLSLVYIPIFHHLTHHQSLCLSEP